MQGDASAIAWGEWSDARDHRFRWPATVCRRSRVTPRAMTHRAHAVLPMRPTRFHTGKPGTAVARMSPWLSRYSPLATSPAPTDPGREYPAAHDHHRDGDRPAEDEQLPEMLAEQSTAELVLRRPRRAHGGLRGGVTGDVGFGQRRDDEDQAQEPDQRQQDRGGSDEGRGAPRHGRWTVDVCA